MSIFKIQDFKHIEDEANDIAKNIIECECSIVKFNEKPLLPDKLKLEFIMPKTISSEDMGDLQLNLALLNNYSMHCNRLIDGIKIIYDATCLNPTTFAINKLTSWLLEYSKIYGYIIRYYMALNSMLEIIELKSSLTTTNNALNDHLNSLKATIKDLRSSLEDKETINVFLSDKNKQLESQLFDISKKKKRTGRTNSEVVKIISDTTKNHVSSKHLRLGESTISRYNTSCKNGKVGKYQYPGNNAPLERLQMWAIERGIYLQKIEDKNLSDEVQQKRFERKILYLPNDTLEKYYYSSQDEQAIYGDEGTE